MHFRRAFLMLSCAFAVFGGVHIHELGATVADTEGTHTKTDNGYDETAFFLPTVFPTLNIRSRSATLVAALPGKGATVYFYLNSSFVGSVYSGNSHSLTVVTLQVNNLSPSTEYHVRVVAIYPQVKSRSENLESFTTRSALPVSRVVSNQSRALPRPFFACYGTPAICDGGGNVYLATWINPSSLTNINFLQATKFATLSKGVFSGEPETEYAQTGWLVPPDNGIYPTSVRYVSFSTPAISTDGEVAVIAKVKDPGALPSKSTVISWKPRPWDPPITLQTNWDLPDIPGAKIESFDSFSVNSSDLLTMTTLAKGPGGVTAENNVALFAFDAWGLSQLLLRTGDLLQTGTGLKTISSIAALGVVKGSPGQGRGHAYADWTNYYAARVTLTDGSQAVITGNRSTAYWLRLGVALETGDAADPSLPGSQWKSFGAPDVSTDGSLLPIRGTIVSGSNEYDFIGAGTFHCRSGEAAPDTNGAVFVSFLDPVATSGSNYAFTAKLSGTNVTPATNTGIWWNDGGGLGLLARARTMRPPGTPAGAAWKEFTSLAMPGGGYGPIFLANLVVGKAGVTTANNMGVWGVDSTGALRKIIRTGDSLSVGTTRKQIKLLTLLNAVPGSPSQRRSFNNEGELIYRVTFTDGSQEIVETQLP